MMAPEQQSMLSASDALDGVLGRHEALLVKQTAKGCFQELFGCEAETEYKVSSMDYAYLRTGSVLSEGAMALPDELYSVEQSHCCCRIFWKGGRPLSIEVSQGGEAGGSPLLRFEKPCGCPLCLVVPTDQGNLPLPCCCMLPELSGKSPSGEDLGIKSKFMCDSPTTLCVPKLHYMEDEKTVYILRPPTCCFDCCVRCKCGKRGMLVPFFFHRPDTMEPITDGAADEEQMPQILKVWAGLQKECCTSADTFAVFFPRGCDAKRKAGILGLTYLLDFTYFESHGR